MFVIVPGALLLEPLIGKGGIIALGLVVGQLLPLLMLKIFSSLRQGERVCS